MEVVQKNFRLIGKPGKILSLIFMIPSFIVVLICLILRFFFRDVFDSLKGGSPEEPNYGGVVIFLLIFFLLLIIVSLDIIARFSLFVSTITLILSIFCLKYSNKTNDELQKKKIGIYIMLICFLAKGILFMLIAIIALMNDGAIIGIPCLFFTVVYGVISHIMIVNILTLKKDNKILLT